MKTTSKIHLQGGVNFRDLGGCRMADGRTVKPGLLFRSGVLDELTAEDLETLAALPVTHVLDYRDEAEVRRRPDPLWRDVQYECVPAGCWENGAGPMQLLSHAVDESGAFAFMKELYQRLPFDNPAYRRMFDWMRAPETPRLVQHCAIGKDRTGVGSAILLLALGASRQAVIEDYMMTETSLASYRERWLATVDRQRMGEKYDALVCVFSAREAFIEAALDAIESKYGNIISYLQREFGLDGVGCAALQARYLE
ncbi:MAG: tyrosine-protein phosphatase [Proteobacteria bacterium]|nr:tyrosine-protein phosphatase [Pseudomonadota bacterium]MCL2306889.1 tyrosine-protein phosphatase [Pseudomonadota bacterium]